MRIFNCLSYILCMYMSKADFSLLLHKCHTNYFLFKQTERNILLAYVNRGMHDIADWWLTAQVINNEMLERSQPNLVLLLPLL